MIEESVEVLSVEVAGLWVESVSRSTCQACVVKQGCGQNLLQTLGAHTVRMFVPFDGHDPGSFKIGQSVTIGVAESLLVLGPLLVYLFPLFTLLVGLWVGDSIYHSDGTAISGALLGLFGGGFLVARVFDSDSQKVKLYPRLLTKI